MIKDLVTPKVKILFFFYCLAYPLAIAIFLSVPRIVVSITQNNPALLTGAYPTHTFHYAQIYVCLYLLLQLISQRLAVFVTVLILTLDLIIRIVELIVQSIFGHRFNGLFFSHLSWNSVLLSASMYWWLALIVIGLLIIMIILINPVLSNRFPNGKTKLFLTVIVTLLAIRSTWFLGNIIHHGEQDIAAYSFVKQGRDYYKANSYEKLIQWDKEELKFRETLGMNPSVSEFVIGSKKTNLIVIYFEGLGANFSSLFNSDYPRLIPSADNFARENAYFNNFYNSTTPTISSLVSMTCGLSIHMDNRQLKIHTLASNKPCYSNILHREGYFQTFLVGSKVSFGGRKAFYQSHKFNEALGLSYLIQEHPEWKGSEIKWGLDDKYLFQGALEKLEELRKKPPYHLALLTVNSHHPYHVSKECGIYKEGDILLNAQHCTDVWLGKFLEELKRRGFFNEAAILVLGDHQSHGKRAYGKIFFALHHPSQKLNKVIETVSHTPDFAPTILNLAGFQGSHLGIGKSVFNERKQYQRIVAEFFEASKGNFLLDRKVCPPEKAVLTRIKVNSDRLTACERKKLLIHTNMWLVE